MGDTTTTIWPVLYDPPQFAAFYRRYWQIVRQEYKKPRALAVRYVGIQALDVTRVLRLWSPMTPGAFDQQKPRLAQAFPKAWARVGAYLCSTMGRVPEAALWLSAEAMYPAADKGGWVQASEAWQAWTPPVDTQSLGARFFRLLYGVSSPRDVARALKITPLALSYLFHGQWVPRLDTLRRKGWDRSLPELVPPARWHREGPSVLAFFEGRWVPAEPHVANPLRHSPARGGAQRTARASRQAPVAGS